jgi:putative transposase
MVFNDKIANRLKEIFQEIAERYGFEIIEQGIERDHVHLFVSAPPRYSTSRLVQILKSISAIKLFKEFPELHKLLWGAELWSDGYFVRATGDKVTSQTIQKYIRYQRAEEDRRQLKLDF